MKLGKVAFCSTGGGASGICQVGMLKAAHDLGLEYNTILGTSVGALNAVLYHQGDLDVMEYLWMNIKNSDVYSSNPFSWGQTVTEKAAIYDSSPLYRLIKKHINYSKVQSNPRDFWINATDATKQDRYSLESKTLSEEELATFIFASAAAPVYFPPVKFRGRTLLDGGLVNNFSLTEAVYKDCDTLVVFRPSFFATKPIKNITDMIGLVVKISSKGYWDEELRAIQEMNKILSECKKVCPAMDLSPINTVEISPDRDFGIDILDFNYKEDRKQLIDYGYYLAKDILERAFN